MLEPQKMDRVLIVGTKDVMEPAINALHDLNLVHLEDYVEEEDYFKIGKPLNVVTSLSEKLLKLRSIKSYLGTKDKPVTPETREKVLRDVDKYLARPGFFGIEEDHGAQCPRVGAEGAQPPRANCSSLTWHSTCGRNCWAATRTSPSSSASCRET